MSEETAARFEAWAEQRGSRAIGPVYAWDEQAQVLLDGDRPPDAR